MNLNDIQFTQATDEMARHIEDAKISKISHFAIAEHFAHLESRAQLVGAISFVGIIVFWFVSTQIFTIVQQFGGTVSPAIRMTTESVIPIAFAIANVVSSTLLYLYRFGEKAHQHRHAAHRYHRFWRKCLNWRTDFPDASRVDGLVARIAQLRDELSEINDAAPDIVEWAWKSVDTELAKGGTRYAVDEENVAS